MDLPDERSSEIDAGARRERRRRNVRRLPPLTALRAFEAVGRLGNVREAAEELNVTPAAVSHQIRALEEHLQMELFTRGARTLQLSRAGGVLLGSVTEAFQLLHDGAERVARLAETRSLVVNSLPTFASNFLVPRLSQFQAAHPEFELEVNTAGRFGDAHDLRQIGADLAIRAGLDENAWPGLRAERLVPETMFPVCAPSLLEGPNALRTPPDLARHTLLIVSRTPEGWPDWLEAAREDGWPVDGIDPNHGTRFDTIQLAMTAAIEGMGVVIGRKPLVDAYLESGLLVAPFELQITSKLAYWLVYPPSLAGSPKLTLFRDWLSAELGLPPAADQAWPTAGEGGPARKSI